MPHAPLDGGDGPRRDDAERRRSGDSMFRQTFYVSRSVRSVSAAFPGRLRLRGGVRFRARLRARVRAQMRRGGKRATAPDPEPEPRKRPEGSRRFTRSAAFRTIQRDERAFGGETRSASEKNGSRRR